MKEPERMRHIAGRGFLGSYVDYARTLTGAPLAYHLATGLGIVAAAVGSNARFIGTGDQETWPNLYILLIGETGSYKSTAISIGCNLLERAFAGIIAPNEFSREQFLVNLQKRPTSLLKVSEFSTLLSQMDRSYQFGLKEMFTDLYDPYRVYSRTLRGFGGKGEEIIIKRPALTILGASTPEWLVGHLQRDDFRSGFMPRFMMWPSDIMEHDPGPLVRGDAFVANGLVKQLAQLGTVMDATVIFSDAARDRIKTFRDNSKSEANLENWPDELAGLISRSGTYAAKLAVLLTISDEGKQTEYEVKREAAVRATMLMGWLLKAAVGLFETHIVFEKFEKEAQRILRLIPDDGADWSTVLRRAKMGSVTLKPIIDTLVERGEVLRYSEERGGRGRSTNAVMLRRLYPNLRRNAGNTEGNSGEQGDSPSEFHAFKNGKVEEATFHQAVTVRPEGEEVDVGF